MFKSSFWLNKKVLITGHTGFKGTWLTIWLTMLGAKVYGYSLPAQEKSLFNQIHHNLKKKFFHFESDILNFTSLENFIKEVKPDIIFHLAAQSLVLKGYENPIKTWEINLIGSLNILEAAKNLKNNCAVVMITTDKVYENKEWLYGYRENDPLGGHDPYSASKAGAEIAIKSWKLSYCSRDLISNLFIATARAGNVVGGGDWSENRLIPDIVRSLKENKTIFIRNPKSTRPWQHVLEPLYGYLLLAEKLFEESSEFCEPFNFGPDLNNNKNVEDVVDLIIKKWPGKWEALKNKANLHEANLLHLNSDKASKLLNWNPKWNFEETINKTIIYYQDISKGADPFKRCLQDINNFME